MKMYTRRRARWGLAWSVAFLLSLTLAAGPCWASSPLIAYVGPGPGLGLIGSLLAVLAAVVLGLLGLVLYPLRLFRQWRRGKSAVAELQAREVQAPEDLSRTASSSPVHSDSPDAGP